MAGPFQPGPAENLALAAKSFFAGSYDDARRRLAELESLLPAEKRLWPLLGAANLRGGNFSLARDYFQRARAAGFDNEETLALTHAGLALALFSLMDIEGSMEPARRAYDARMRLLGPDSAETLSAANILSGVLIGLDRN